MAETNQTGIGDFFGSGFDFGKPGAGGDQSGRYPGAGQYGLPQGFAGWDAASRYAFAPANQFVKDSQGVGDFFKSEMNKDYSKILLGESKKQIDNSFQQYGRAKDTSLTRSGLGGGAASSPLTTMMLETENAARAGAYGEAARMAVFQAQSMQTQMARSYQDLLSQRFQAMMAPAQLQAARRSQAPIGAYGPSPLGAGIGAAGGFFGALS